LAGCPKECCAKCGAPLERVVEKEGQTKRQAMNLRGASAYASANGNALNYKGCHDLPERQSHTTGFRPTCSCNAGTAPGIVLDPFAGSGTTLQVAIQEQRIGWGCELNPEYIQLLEKRLSGTQVKLF
jgi:hypothetical protein